MKFHKEGYPTLFLSIIFIGVLVFITKKYFSDNLIITSLVYIACTLLFVIVVQFFRSPRRTTNLHDNDIISPADGKVVVIEEVNETEYFKDKRIQVSVFMSPVNVHVNRYPISGKVKYAKYHPGKYLVAWHPKSSTENERTSIVVENENNKAVLFRQIAGALARRIVFYCKENDTAVQGNEFGFIKFGSRVDLLLPADAKVTVALNQKVIGGVTVLAKFEA
jgi:phosphatidylserine decarboxylase